MVRFAFFISLMVAPLLAQNWQGVEVQLTGSASAFDRPYGHSWADVDGDGDFDLFLNGSHGLYINRLNENGTFELRDDLMPAGLPGGGWATTFGDFDNDGDPDIHLGNGSIDYLLQNNWPAKFVDVAPELNITDPKWNQSINWADYNKDGLLDLYITHERPSTDGAHELYQNNYPKPFLPRFPLGNEEDIVGLADKNSHAYGLTWGDIDLDGDLDVVTSACGTSSTIPGENPHNKIYRNNFPAPIFEDLSLATGLVTASEVQNGSSSYWGQLFDYDGDAFPDLLIGKTGSGGQHRLWRNTGINTGDFGIDEVPISTHTVSGSSAFLRGATAGDFDNDGDLDLFTTSEGLYENLGDGSFQQRTDLFPTRSEGADVSFVDYDLDGDLDIFNFKDLYENPGTPGNNWIAIELEGAGTLSGTPRSAHHVKISLTAGGVTQHREHRYMVGSYSQHMLPTHFGLGTATVVDEIRIKWMNGETDVYTNVTPNQYITYVEAPNCVDGFTIDNPVQLYCLGDTLNLEASTLGEGSPYWYVIEGADIDPAQFGSPRALTTTFTPSRPGHYSVAIRYQQGCPRILTMDLYDTDYNKDGLYNFNDTLAIMQYWNTSENVTPYDRDTDGMVSLLDLLLSCPSSSLNQTAALK